MRSNQLADLFPHALGRIAQHDVALDIMLGYPAKSVWEEIGELVAAHLKSALPGVASVTVSVTSKVVPHAVQRGVKLVDGVEEHYRGGQRQGRCG